MIKDNKRLSWWEVHWINGHARARGTTLINAVRTMRIKRAVYLGMLVKVRNKGITYFWSSEQFIKYAHLIQMTKQKESPRSD